MSKLEKYVGFSLPYCSYFSKFDSVLSNCLNVRSSVKCREELSKRVRASLTPATSTTLLERDGGGKPYSAVNGKGLETERGEFLRFAKMQAFTYASKHGKLKLILGLE